jgi:coenzyme F420-reducing hydrogenase alpha subunit
MHKDADIKIEQLSKIEGHADLDIKIRNGEVADVKLRIEENKRFYTQAIRGMSYMQVPQLVSRICGTCSIAHLSCCIEAVENIVGFKPSKQTQLLRNLAMYGLMIRDHAMHLYLFSLPDVFGKDSVLDFDESLHKYVHHAFAVKGAGNNLSKLIMGRSVHATLCQVGGFLKVPDKEGVKKSVEELKKVREDVIKLIEVFANWPERFERKTNFVGIVSKDYNFLEGRIKSTDGLDIPENKYWEHLDRVVIPYSQAEGFEFEGKEYLVGALARMNLNKNNLHKDTKKDAVKFLRMFPSENIFHNNLAQAIEILHSIDRSIELLETHSFKEEKKPAIKPKTNEGVGVIEAPRGTLYYMLSLNADGTVRFGNLVIPTAQNQIKMQSDIKYFLPQLLDKPEEEIKLELEKLIRAYDPCMSCASHFLKVNWI